LLFARGDVLMAQHFGTKALRLSGDAFRVLTKVARSASSPRAGFSISDGGILLTSGAYFGDQLTWFDRGGKRLGAVGTPGLHFYPRIAPDQRTLLVDAFEAETFGASVWLFPMDGSAPARFTFATSMRPIWSKDGSRVFFEGGDGRLYLKSTTGAENETTLLETRTLNGMRLLCDQTHDARFLIYSEATPKTGF